MLAIENMNGSATSCMAAGTTRIDNSNQILKELREKADCHSVTRITKYVRSTVDNDSNSRAQFLPAAVFNNRNS